MRGSMADIQSATAEIMRGKKERQIEETTGQKYNGLSFHMATIISEQLCVAKEIIVRINRTTVLKPMI